MCLRLVQLLLEISSQLKHLIHKHLIGASRLWCGGGGGGDGVCMYMRERVCVCEGVYI